MSAVPDNLENPPPTHTHFLSPPSSHPCSQQGFKGFQVAAEHHAATVPFRFGGAEYTLGHGSVVIAAITSCTNTSNPSVMLGAGGCLKPCRSSRESVTAAAGSSRRAPRQEGGAVRSEREAVHQDQPVPRQRRGHLLPEGERRHGLPVPAGVDTDRFPL